MKGLSVAQEDFQPRAPVHLVKQDPLIAVEIRHWFAKVLEANCTVLEILGNAFIVEDCSGFAGRRRYLWTDDGAYDYALAT